MIDKATIIIAVLGVGLGAGAVFAYKAIRTFEMPILDPTVFPYSRDETQGMLVSARNTLPRRDKDGQIQIWGVSRSDRGVVLNMQYASRAPVLRCEAVVTAVTPTRSRVAADCGGDTKSDSAIARTQDALLVPMFEEHIQATMNKRAFKRENATGKEVLTVFQNLGGMQREALKRSDEAQRSQAEARR